MPLTPEALRKEIASLAHRHLVCDLGEPLKLFSDAILALLQPHADYVRALEAALVVAKATIRTWHGMGMAEDEEETWRLYQESPEMRQINAALARVEGVKEKPE